MAEIDLRKLPAHRKVEAFEKIKIAYLEREHSNNVKLTPKKLKEVIERVSKDMGEWGEGKDDDCWDDYGKAFLAEEPNEFKGKDPDELLKEAYKNIYEILDYYMDLPDDLKNIVTLWVVGTYFHKDFSTYPYLFVNAMRGSGKTRLLKIIASLSWLGNLTSSLTESVMFRSVGTLALDEFESVGGKEKQTLRELLNASYKKGTKVFRMKKKKDMEGESQVVEEFEPYRPLAMANIWGMEEVLGDRCINILLEKSNDTKKTNLIEDFDEIEIATYTKKLLIYVCSVGRCSVGSDKNIKQKWNAYVKDTTHNYTHTHTTHTYTNIHKDLKELFDMITETGIEGRHLELFFSLFMLAKSISPEVLKRTMCYSKKVVEEKKVEEITESKDVAVYSLVAKETPDVWKEVRALTNTFKFIVGEEDWINPTWIGRALKRLNLVTKKKRVGQGIQVMLDVEKAKTKEAIFKPKEEKEDG